VTVHALTDPWVRAIDRFDVEELRDDAVLREWLTE
jgi:hypothetical protein